MDLIKMIIDIALKPFYSADADRAVFLFVSHADSRGAR